MKRLIYVVDDEPLQLHYLQAALRKQNYLVQTFSDPYELLQAVEARVPDAAVVDLVMPQLSGTELIREIRKRSPKLPLIAVTAYPEIETAIGAVRAGANDYLKKPFQTAELQLVVERLLETAHLRESLESLIENNIRDHSPDRFIGISKAAEAIRTEIERLIGLENVSILISGENGSGKSFAARILHYGRPDASKRLIELDCSHYSDEDLRTELFGEDIINADGSFFRHPSLCEVSEGGTILLDNIASTTKEVQTELHRYLTAAPSGDAEEQQEHTCRVIVTGPSDDEKGATPNPMDPGLHAHLSRFHLRIPPLRDRGDDIVPLAEYFIAQSESSRSVRVQGLTEAARRALRRYTWPGNVRELKSVIERALVTTQTQLIDEKDLHLGATYHTKGDESVVRNTLTSLRELEIEQIRRVLSYTKGDVTKAAQILGISRKSLWERRKRYSLG